MHLFFLAVLATEVRNGAGAGGAMDVLADEIARARKEAQERRAAAAAGRPSKYQRRGDLERSAASEVAQVKADGSKEAVPATPPRASGDGKEAESGAAAESTPILPQAELVRRLRAFSVPVLLFGETPAEQNARLRSHRLQVRVLVETWVCPPCR